MTENKNKLRMLTAQEVYDNIDDYGVLSLGGGANGLPKNTQFIAKILEPVNIEFVEALDKNVCKFVVEYKDNNTEPFQFQVRVSESAVKRMEAKHPDNSYVEKRAFFSKAIWSGKNVHHVNVILKDKSSKKPELIIKNKEPETNNSGPELSPAMQEVVQNTESKSSLVAGAPADKTPDFPEELKEWSEKIKGMKDDFYSHFCTDDVLQGRAQPIAFLDWMKDKDACETDYIAEFDGDKDMKATSIFWAIVAMFEGK